MTGFPLQPPLLVGRSAAMRELEQQLVRAARSDAKVLITGESGVGKEIAARQIHRNSSRCRAPLVALNCAGMPETLLESELFGHTRGSFTGAVADKPGIFEAAQSGTVFLDEVGEMSLRMQSVLLRFLETGELQRVGAVRSPRVDVRIISATNRDLFAAVDEKQFRQDLYYRLNVIHIAIPPLRERRDDIAPLVAHYCRVFAEQYRVETPVVPDDVLARLEAYPWPGNVRELKNVVERMVVMREEGESHTSHLPPDLQRCLNVRVEPQAGAAPKPSIDELFDEIVGKRKSFWSAVYTPFMLRDLTRADVVSLIERGLRETAGSYKLLVAMFNIEPVEYRRFLNFLRKHQCHVQFQPFRKRLPVRALRPVPAREPMRIPA